MLVTFHSFLWCTSDARHSLYTFYSLYSSLNTRNCEFMTLVKSWKPLLFLFPDPEPAHLSSFPLNTPWFLLRFLFYYCLLLKYNAVGKQVYETRITSCLLRLSQLQSLYYQVSYIGTYSSLEQLEFLHIYYVEIYSENRWRFAIYATY